MDDFYLGVVGFLIGVLISTCLITIQNQKRIGILEVKVQNQFQIIKQLSGYHYLEIKEN